MTTKLEASEINGELLGSAKDRNDRINLLRQGLSNNGGNIDNSHPNAESIVLKQYIQENVLTSKEACELLRVSRQRLFAIVSSGKLTPIESTPHGNWFLRSDIEEYNKARAKLPPEAIEDIKQILASGNSAIVSRENGKIKVYEELKS